MWESQKNYAKRRQENDKTRLFVVGMVCDQCGLGDLCALQVDTGMKIRVSMKETRVPLEGFGGGGGNRQFFQLLAQSAAVAVKERIKDGLTLDGDPMLTGAGAPGSTGRYTEAYEDWKAEGRFRSQKKLKSGKRSRAHRISKAKMAGLRASLYEPNSRFRLSGRMLNAFNIIELDEKHSKVGFPDEEVAARAHGNDQRRPTFALTKEETDEIVDYAVEQMKTEGRP